MIVQEKVVRVSYDLEAGPAQYRPDNVEIRLASPAAQVRSRRACCQARRPQPPVARTISVEEESVR